MCEQWFKISLFTLFQTKIQDNSIKLFKMRHPVHLLPPHNHEKEPGRHTLANDIEWTNVDHIPDIAVYTGPHGMEQEVGLDELCEPLDLFLHFIDSELIAKVKQQTNLYSRQKLAKLWAQNKLSPGCRFRL
jgi:hypothetical protein